ncbi:hypothetical protein GOBAR_AA24853 [Gossypium barbadense]|uniref:Uncharacterized protein n=1 Tax=Gossypium barbadense TaxID=3634 RepID=A0A2P5WXK3_GOSBA|nr:hypothetical protein GOBAR_AA24853 [Gossypium barbadense]
MGYTPGSSHFPMAVMHTMIYMPFMYKAPIGSPLVIPSTYETQQNYAHSSWVTQTPLASLFYQGEQRKPQPQPEVEPRRNPACNH